MSENSTERLPHLFVKDTATSSRYTKPRRVVNITPNIPQRDRQAHAQQLLNQVEQIQQQESEIIQEQKAFGLDVSNGIYLAFESEQDFELKFESLGFQPSGIELCTVKDIDNKTIATVFVPEGKLTHFLKKITEYQEKNTSESSNKPKNKDLVESINAIKLAALESLWTDDLELLPADNITIWWEVWLRRSSKINFEAFLRDHANQLQMKVSNESIKFLDRTVILVYGTKQQMSRSINLLGSIAEIRKAKDTADFFTSMNRIDQQEWINNTVEQLTLPADDAPSVCILDTGVNEGHPLLSHATKGTHSYLPVWGTDDRDGHGTSMAGLALYGDLTEILATTMSFDHTHWLESVKIIPNAGELHENYLYGAITQESIARVEIDDLSQRIYCMAVSATKDRERGRPSSWSAAIDAMTSGYTDEQHRLVVLSSGNTDSSYRHQYPESNMTDEVHDPGQSWNALTVGGYTEKVWLDTVENPGWKPIAQAGDLSPASCTSMDWQKTWPIKPDIVMEAGNMAINPAYEQADYIDYALQLLSTGHKFLTGKQLVSFGDTSAAAALAANLATKLQAQYPEYWPETIRALMIHSAKWTPAMKSRFAPFNTKDKYRQLLRYCGYGVPNEQALFWSARNELTLVAQDTLQPYFKEKGTVKTRDINLHNLPWASDVLQNLPPDTEVEMKVTLSYFIEPSPGSRGWVNKYRYASHGLRFDVRRSLESIEDFKQRINQYVRDEEYQSLSNSDSDEWLLGGNLRGLGSVHSDTWKGSASALAEKGYIAVYPVIGWWKERANFERWGKSARYALVVSIKTPEVETDIYTAVENQLSVPVSI